MTLDAHGVRIERARVTKISLVRHGETDWNLKKRIQGRSDIPLNETGRDQAAATAGVLGRRQWDMVFSSTLSRAKETAEIIAGILGLNQPVGIPALVERNYGEAEGMTAKEILLRWPDGLNVPGRESRASVVERVTPALVDLGEMYPASALIVVTHGAVISSLVRVLSNQALPAPGEVISNGSVHDFAVVDGALELVRFNAAADDHDPFTAAVT